MLEDEDTPGPGPALVTPASPAGWLLVAHPAGAAQLTPPLADLHAAGLATIRIELPRGRDAAAARAGLQAAREQAGGLPLAYLGVDSAAAAGWRAGCADALIAWGPTSPLAWTPAPRGVPSLIVADREMRVLRSVFAVRMRLGAHAEMITDADLGFVAGWYADRLLTPAVSLLRPHPRGISPRRTAIAAAAAVTLAASGGAAQPALAQLPDFSSGARLGSAQVAGDGAPASGGGTVLSGGKRLPGSHIHGDGLPSPFAVGSQALIDGAGFKWFINTNITFSTSSSASGAMDEASYTHSVDASTLNGGTAPYRLNDAYDGYNTLCVSLNNTVAPCETGNANFVIYNKTGPATVEANGRQVDFAPKTAGNFTLQRKVFVPSDDHFARWLNYVTNNGSSPGTITLVIANNLGSDANTLLTGTTSDPSGATPPTTSDNWFTSFQNFSGTTTTDPRLGHVLQGTGAPTPLAGIHFANGSDHPYWGYTITLDPGQTAVLMNFAVAEPSKAASRTKADQLANLLDPHELDDMSASDIADVVNFSFAPPTAGADSYTVVSGATLSTPAPGTLANDTPGPAGGPLTAALVSGPAHAAAFSLNADGSFTYTPAAGFTGSDSFTYQATDPRGRTSPPTTVTINVAAPPSAPAHSFSTKTNGAFNIAAPGVLAGAGGGLGGQTSAVLVTPPAHASSFSLSPDGAFAYAPVPGYSGPDSFTFRVRDGQGNLSAPVTITIQVAAPVVCYSSRYIVAHPRTKLSLSHHVRVKYVKATLNGTPLRVVHNSVIIDLKGKPRGTYTLKMTVGLSDGTVQRLTRTYTTCSQTHG